MLDESFDDVSLFVSCLIAGGTHHNRVGIGQSIVVRKCEGKVFNL